MTYLLYLWKPKPREVKQPAQGDQFASCQELRANSA